MENPMEKVSVIIENLRKLYLETSGMETYRAKVNSTSQQGTITSDSSNLTKSKAEVPTIG